MKCILPVEESPMFKTYAFWGDYLSILQGSGYNVFGFLYNNFLILSYFMIGNRFGYTAGYKLRRLFMKKFVRRLPPDYLELLKNNIKKGKYAIVTLNQKKIESREYDFWHDWLIHGFDDENKIVFALGYAKECKGLSVFKTREFVGFGVKGLYGLFGIGSLVLYCGSFMQVISGVMKMAVTFGKTEEMVPIVNYYYDIMNIEDDMVYGEKEIDLTSKFEIEFKDVSFKYPGSENYALEGINLTIHNGEHLAVVGRNGSGKTTFIKLMCRLYDVDSGEILINGINIKEYSKESLTKLYSVVFQDFKLFAVPLCDNIAADKKYDKDNLYCCLEQANIKDRVERMGEKENTYLYKNIDKKGVDISGGEAQKLALARAFYKDSPLVILDEPTAALDPVAENEIYSRFNSFTENKTAIYISHRLSSCIFCDRIAVFDNAKLVEQGTHEQLLNSGKKYSELWNAQAQYYI